MGRCDPYFSAAAGMALPSELGAQPAAAALPSELGGGLYPGAHK